MARNPRGGQYTLTATAATLTDALSLTGNLHFAKITIKNATGAANAAFIGNSTSLDNTPTAALMELAADQAYTFGGDGRGYYSSDEIYVVGTVNAANILFITLEE
jgi:hypothetical protein